MSVKITVNGKFNKTCGKQRSILDDPVTVRKELEDERRKQRLKEVREESKNLARKIRNDVAAEKERQLRNLEAIKAQELDCWRQHVLTQKTQDYRSALFQVGAAHYAAKLENEAQAAKRNEQERCKDFRKQLKSRQENTVANFPKKNSLQAAGKQTPKVLNKCTMHRAASGAESERSCTDSTSSTTDQKEAKRRCAPSFTCSSESSSTSSEESDVEEEEVEVEEQGDQRSMKQKCIKVCQKPSVIVEVDVNSNDSVVISCNDGDDTGKNMEESSSEQRRSSTKRTNAKKSNSKSPAKQRSPSKQTAETTLRSPRKRVNQEAEVATQHSPRKRGSQQEAVATQHLPGKRGNQQVTVDTQYSPRKRGSQRPVVTLQHSPGKRDSQQAAVTKPSLKNAAQKPRYTQVSDLIQKKKTTTDDGEEVIPLVPPPSLQTESPVKSQQKSSTSTKSSGVAVTVSGATITLGSGSTGGEDGVGVGGGAVGVGRVQFYDYRTKYCREYEQPAHAVQPASVRDLSQPNAREQACIEKQLQQTRELEVGRMRRRSAERGQKALEREQVRRDCIELTEKLEALTKQYPQLLPPNDAHLLRPHQIAAQTACREERLNAAVEDILIRPAIITLPEVGRTQRRRATCTSRSTTDDELNLGAPPAGNTPDSAESCNSLLLGYVDDQSKQLRGDLNEYARRPEYEDKSARLRRLLQRIEELRQALCAELQKSSTAASNGGNVQHVIDGVSDVRRERERILSDEDRTEGAANTSVGHKQRNEMEHKEMLLEQKLRELCAIQNLLTKQKEETVPVSTNGKTKRPAASSSDKPVEIVIRVKGDARRSKGKGAKSTRKVSTLIGKNRNVTKKRSSTKMPDEAQRTAAALVTNGQNSYDSNSTSYRSLPPRMTNPVENVVKQFEQMRQQDTDDGEEEQEEEYENYEEVEVDEAQSPSVPATTLRSAPAKDGLQRRASQLNPIIAHYVQRLLGMSRSSVQALAVDSSEIETPSSSIVNTSSNMVGGSIDETQERLSRVQQFIEDNRSFIGDLEETLRSQSNAPLETSMRMFEDIWQQRLRTQKKKRQMNVSMRVQRGSSESQRSKATQRAVKDAKAVEDLPPAAASVYQAQPAPRGGRSHNRVTPKIIVQSAANSQQPEPTSTMRMRDKSIETEEARGLSAEQQIERYAQLTDNCTQRIAELTALINQVRQEKQRLMEVTLSSVSDGRNSTEYVELPDDEQRSVPAPIEQDVDRIKTPSQTQRARSPSRSTPTELPTSSLEQLPGEQVPLEKGKQTGVSRDSGISMSRPITAQDGEPPSQASANSAQLQRKTKPPPTMQRYSPQLVRDEVAHELSTIVEVDTPVATRRPGASTDSGRSIRVAPQAVPFPTFEQYARELNLDVTQLDPETTMRMQQEFDELVTNLQAAAEMVPNYQAFPSLTAYLCQLTAHEVSGQCCQSPETIADLLACLRLANLTIKSFPSRHEYMRQRAAHSPEMPFIETTSLENISDGCTCTATGTGTGTESESMNIEKELMRRNILKRSFASTKPNGGQIECRHRRNFASESGIDKLSSTSENHSGDVERDLLALGINWPAVMRQKTKESEARSGNTSSSASERRPIANRAPQSSAPQMQSRGVRTETTPVSKNQQARRLSAQAAGERRASSQSPSRMQYANRGATTVPRNVLPVKQQQQPGSVRRSASSSPEHGQSGADRELPPQPHSAPHSPARRQNASRDAMISPRSTSQSPRRNEYVSRDANGGPGGSKRTKGVLPLHEFSADRNVNANPMQQPSDGRKSRQSTRSSGECGFLSDFGRPLNLRDFLTKELLKHVTNSSSSSTDDSLRSQFLQSIIESITPRTNTGGTNNVERQKTSTPVTESSKSRTTSSSSTSQLFSGESRISSVHYHEQQSLHFYARSNCAEPTGQ